MKCYLATEKDYQKISDFINSQPKLILGRECVDNQLKGVQEITVTKETLKKICDTRQGYKIFVCEDDLGNIRYIHSRERRGKEFNPAEPEMSVYGNGIMTKIDIDSKNTSFKTGLWEWAIKYYYDNYNIKIGEDSVPVEEVDFIKGFFGDDVVEVKNQFTIPATANHQERYNVRLLIDFESWLKKIGYVK